MNFDLLVDLHLNQNRQGPGSKETTLRALNSIPDIQNADHFRIADIGCGTGSSSIILAEQTHAQIDAIDLFGAFLEKLKWYATNMQLDGQIHCTRASMEELPFQKNVFDLIWSEGAIYNMGFKKGVNYWKNFLKKGGYLAVSEICWTTNERPKEIEEHWMKEYAEMGGLDEKTSVLQQAGFELINHFYLPENCWLEEYYNPIEKELENFLKRHHNSPIAEEIAEATKQEIALYKTYKDYFSYVFLIARKKN